MAVFALGLSLVTLLFSEGVGGVRNWISLAGVSVQTTEISKCLYIPVCAYFLGREDEGGKKTLFYFYSYTVNLPHLSPRQASVSEVGASGGYRLLDSPV